MFCIPVTRSEITFIINYKRRPDYGVVGALNGFHPELLPAVHSTKRLQALATKNCRRARKATKSDYILRQHDNIWMPLATAQHVSDEAKCCLNSRVLLSVVPQTATFYLTCPKELDVQARLQQSKPGAFGRNLNRILLRSEITSGKCWFEFRRFWVWEHKGIRLVAWR